MERTWTPEKGRLKRSEIAIRPKSSIFGWDSCAGCLQMGCSHLEEAPCHESAPLLSLLLVTVTAVRVSAQVYPYRDGTPGVTGYLSEVLAEVMIQESEFIRLAEAVPSDKYRWRPALDVRSIAEVSLHASAANFNLYKLVGTPTPAGVDTKTLEQSTTDKAKITATLEASYAHAKAAIRAMSDADLEKTLEWNRGKITERGVLLYIVQRIAQHLGQQIAYVRSIGVVPPWTLDPPRKD